MKDKILLEREKKLLKFTKWMTVICSTAAFGLIIFTLLVAKGYIK